MMASLQTLRYTSSVWRQLPRLSGQCPCQRTPGTASYTLWPWKSGRKYNVVKPGKVTPRREVPAHIPKPGYALDPDNFQYAANSRSPEIKTSHQIEGMRHACRIARCVLEETAAHIRPGRTTDELDQVSHKACVRLGAYPSPLLYRGFPKSVCTSVNNVACHGIPDDRPLEEGDIINVDVTVYYKGFHGDLSATYPVGEIDGGAKKLIRVTEECLDLAIAECGPGTPFQDLGTIIQGHCEEEGFEIVPHFCGHGIGSYFHGPPEILHYVNDSPGTMAAGMTFTIEPILSEGDWDINILADGWTAVTKDESRTAQSEHTILITENGCEVLTACSEREMPMNKQSS